MRIPKFKKPNPKNVLLYYSVILSTILIIGGFWTARSGREIVSNLLFLPVVVFLWLTLIKYRRDRKLADMDIKTTGKKAKIKG